MRLIVDSDVLIDVLRRRADARDLVANARRRDDELWSVAPVRTEIVCGQLPGEELATRQLLNVIAWLDVDVELADRAGELGRPYARSHPGIDAVDLLLAAATERLGGRLLTRNVRHFPMFRGLEPAY